MRIRAWRAALRWAVLALSCGVAALTLAALALSCGVAALIAPAAALAEACPNEAARSGPSASLPDCRAYEQVTPVDKSTIVQDISFTESAEYAIPAVDGNRIALLTHVVGLGQTPEPFESFVIFARTGSGWQTESVNPPGSGGTIYGESGGSLIFTPDLSRVGLESNDSNLLPTSPDQTFQVGPPGGPFTVIATTPNALQGHTYDDWLAGATPDLSRIYLDSDVHTLAGASTGSVEGARDLYQWAGGKLSVVDVNTDGSPVSLCGADFKAVAEDGSKVFFRAPDSHTETEASGEPACQEPTRLYMRVDGSRTVEVSAPVGVVDPDGFKGVEFKGATADGSKVFFTSATELTKDDEGYHDNELYEYDTVTATLTRISSGTTGAAAANNGSGSTTAGGVRYVLPSKDGSRVYFTSSGKLTPDAPAITPQFTGEDLYRYNTITGETHYIATNGGGEAESFDDGEELYGQGEDIEGDGGMSFAATPDGRFLTFYAKPYVSGSSVSVNDPGNYWQVFRYDDDNGGLICVSCLPSDAPKDRASEFGESWVNTFPTALGAYDNIPPYTLISNDGSYIFFESTMQLVPQAVNVSGGELQALDHRNADVYEWHNGVVSLISSPSDPFRQVLLGASADGSNVFFVSHAQLVPQDGDSSGDIYDARIDGGFAPATESAACEGDTCLTPPAALNDPTPASSSFSGPGNPAPSPPARALAAQPKAKKRCARGTVRKEGRCVKRRKAKRATRRAGGRTRRSAKHDRGGSK